jgi:hypothetical protein
VHQAALRQLVESRPVLISGVELKDGIRSQVAGGKLVLDEAADLFVANANKALDIVPILADNLFQ